MGLNTWNRFRNEIKYMNQEEKEDYLKQLNAELMYSKTRRFEERNSMKVKMLKRQIACLKTSLRVKITE